jgi:hypothetical protein
MGRILRTITGQGSLANLMLVIGFRYKGTLLIEEFSDTLARCSARHQDPSRQTRPTAYPLRSPMFNPKQTSDKKSSKMRVFDVT